MARLNVPPLTRGLLVCLAGLFLVHQAAQRSLAWSPLLARHAAVPWLVVSPLQSVVYPWVYVTATLVEDNPLSLLVAGATYFYGGRYLERAWGSRGLATFLLVVALVPNAGTALLALLGFAVTRSPPTSSIHGCTAVQAGFLVAFKQLVPEHTVTLLRGLVRVRVKHFPALFLLLHALAGVALGARAAAGLAWLGFLAAWTHLRFYQRQPDLAAATTDTGSSTGSGGAPNLRGDASETFAFAYFWPDAVHAPVAAAADAVFAALVATRICTPFSAAEVESGNRQASARGDELPSLMSPSGGVGGGGGGGAGGRRGGGAQARREEAERRRALALRALDARLQQAHANRQAQAVPVPVPVPPTEGSPAEQEASTGESKMPSGEV